MWQVILPSFGFEFASARPTFLLEKPMSEAKRKPFWEKALWLLIKIYAGLCTLLVTVFLISMIRGLLAGGSHDDAANDSAKFYLNSSYEAYTNYEYPKRAGTFYSLAFSLGCHADSGSSVSAADIIHYLGNPDKVFGNTNKSAYVYDYKPWVDDPSTNELFVVCRITDGKLTLFGFGDSTVSPTNLLPDRISVISYKAK